MKNTVMWFISSFKKIRWRTYCATSSMRFLSHIMAAYIALHRDIILYHDCC